MGATAYKRPAWAVTNQQILLMPEIVRRQSWSVRCIQAIAVRLIRPRGAITGKQLQFIFDSRMICYRYKARVAAERRGKANNNVPHRNNVAQRHGSLYIGAFLLISMTCGCGVHLRDHSVRVKEPLCHIAEIDPKHPGISREQIGLPHIKKELMAFCFDIQAQAVLRQCVGVVPAYSPAKL